MICPQCGTNNNMTKEQILEHYGPDFEEKLIKKTGKAVTQNRCASFFEVKSA